MVLVNSVADVAVIIGLAGFFSKEILIAAEVSAAHTPEITTLLNQIDFVKFVDEHDRRRGTNFLETFPELGEFYTFCKSLG